MRVGELSEAVDLPVPTIKYYLRAGLMPAGEALWSTRSAYDESHVARLRLIRVLTEVGKLSLGEVRAVLEALDADAREGHDGSTPAAVELALDALVTRPAPTSKAARTELVKARAAVDELVAGLGWRVRSDAAARDQLAAVLVTLWRNGWPADGEVLARLAPHVEHLVADEAGTTGGDDGSLGSAGGALASAVVSTVLLEQALVALRRLALEDRGATPRRRRPQRGGAGPSRGPA